MAVQPTSSLAIAQQDVVLFNGKTYHFQTVDNNVTCSLDSFNVSSGQLVKINQLFADAINAACPQCQISDLNNVSFTVDFINQRDSLEPGTVGREIIRISKISVTFFPPSPQPSTPHTETLFQEAGPSQQQPPAQPGVPPVQIQTPTSYFYEEEPAPTIETCFQELVYISHCAPTVTGWLAGPEEYDDLGVQEPPSGLAAEFRSCDARQHPRALCDEEQPLRVREQQPFPTVRREGPLPSCMAMPPSPRRAPSRCSTLQLEPATQSEDDAPPSHDSWDSLVSIIINLPEDEQRKVLALLPEEIRETCYESKSTGDFFAFDQALKDLRQRDSDTFIQFKANFWGQLSTICPTIKILNEIAQAEQTTPAALLQQIDQVNPTITGFIKSIIELINTPPQPTEEIDQLRACINSLIQKCPVSLRKSLLSQIKQQFANRVFSEGVSLDLPTDRLIEAINDDFLPILWHSILECPTIKCALIWYNIHPPYEFSTVYPFDFPLDPTMPAITDQATDYERSYLGLIINQFEKSPISMENIMIVVSQLQETDRIKFYENLREDKFVGRLGTLLSSGESAEAKYQRICSEIIDGNIPDTNDDVQKIKWAFLRIPSIKFLLKVSGANERIAPGLSRLQKLGQRLHNLHLPESLNQEELIALFRALPEEYQKQISAQMKAIIFKSAALEAAASARKSDDIEFYLPNAYQPLMFPYLVDALFSIPEIAKVIALTQPDSISPQAIQALQSNLISKGKLAYLTNIWPANGPLNTPTEISSYIQKIEAFFSNITGEGQETMRSQLYTHLLKDIPQGDVSKQQFIRAFNQFVQEFRLQNITLNSEPLIEFARRGDRNIAALYESCQRERSKSSKH